MSQGCIWRSCCGRNVQCTRMCVSPRNHLAVEELMPQGLKEKPSSSPSSSSIREWGVITPFLPFLVVSAGVVHGWLQEELMSSLNVQTPLIIAAFEFVCCTILSIVWLLANQCPLRAPHGQLFRMSVLVLGSLVAGNLALRWVSYPVKVVLKSTKLLPTMAIGALVLHKKYSSADCYAALLICIGLVGLTLCDSNGSAHSTASSPIGVTLLLFAVTCDSLQVTLQERVMRSCAHLTPMHVMAHTNGLAFAVISAYLLSTSTSIAFPSELPWSTMLLYGSSSWVGVCSFIALTREWGATSAVIATNTRKVVTVALSFIMFPKKVQPAFVVFGGAICAGIYLHSRARHSKGKKS